MTALGFVDAEDVARQWISDTYTPVRTGLETPADLADLDAFIHVTRIGGPVVGVRTERATVDVDCYAPTRQAAKDIARQVQWGLEHLAAGARVTLADGSAGVITATGCTVGPSWRPYADTNVFRFGATYLITVQTTN